MKTKLIVVVGPTAVGKTALGIELAERFHGEVISGDSQQVYRQLDIGTAKATAEERLQVPHHLIDVRDVSENYSVYDFVQEASQAIVEIDQRGKVPIIVGGTGLYVQSLLEGYHLGGMVDQQAVLAYRKELQEKSDDELVELVQEADLQIPQFNRRRAIRSLELARFADHLDNQEPAFEPLLIGLSDEREDLYQRINDRVDAMMREGLLEEARWLYETFPEAQACRGIGYKEFFPYFAGEASLDEAVSRVKQHTRQFAKRQLTWFRNRMAVSFYYRSDAETPDAIRKAVEEFLEHPTL